MKCSWNDVKAFSAWSADANPLHSDPHFAKQTFFGQPIAHGMLSVIHALAESPAPRQGSITSLDVDFQGAVEPDREYAVDIPEAGDQPSISVRGDAPVLQVRVNHPLHLEFGATSAAPQELLDVRLHPAVREPEELARGVEVTGRYRIDLPKAAWAAAAGLTPTQSRVLALCSYVVGMEIPGLHSLFVRATVAFKGETTDDTLLYRARTTRFDRNFRLVDLHVDVSTSSGEPVAVAELRAYVPFSPAKTDPRDLAEHLAPSEPLRGKVALVLGASRGLGADMAAALGCAGLHVYAASRSGSGPAAELAEAIAGRGGTVETLQGDAGDAEWCAATREMIRTRHGKLDLLLLNACAPPQAMAVSPDTLATQADYIRENMRLVQVPSGLLLPLVNESRGTVALISSSFVDQAPAGFAHYVALKQAGEGLLRSALREYADTRGVIARPPRLQTTWNDTPTGAAGAIPAWVAAVQIASGLVVDGQGPGLEIIDGFNDLPKAPRAASGTPDGRLGIVATFTTDALLPSLEFWKRELDLNVDVAVAPYAQVLQTLLNPSSTFGAKARGLNVIFLRVRDWLRELPSDKAQSVEFLSGYLRDAARELTDAIRSHRSRPVTDTALVLCPSGRTSNAAESALLEETEAELIATLQDVPGLELIVASEHHERYQADPEAIADPIREDIAHIPYRDAYFHVLGTLAMRSLHRRLAPVRKVVVCDCDNTIWRGVVGEVGAEGLVLDDGHVALHRKLIELSELGTLVCLCSKNEEFDVWNAFDGRPDFPLRREHIVAAMINWQPKSQNIRTLASRLNLGLDSFVFVDDNPVECAEVRANCPEVLTIQWPQEPSEQRRLVEHAWELDAVKGTSEDRRRTELYKEEFKRQELRQSTGSFQDFIESLGLEVDSRLLAAEDLPRASQLTNRTNQFNFTTRRREQADLQALEEAGGHAIHTIRVRDRFGDYGLVGLTIVERGQDNWTVDTFLLSCRVLGRGVEHRMAADLGRLAAAAGASTVTMRVDFTKRNTPARAFVESIATHGRLESDDTGLTCVFDAESLGALEFKAPAEEQAEEETAQPAAAAPAGSAAAEVERLRRRETQIARTASALSTLDGLRQAMGGSAAPGAEPRSAQDVDIEAVVHEAFAAALRIPSRQVASVNRLDALGCDSLKIVEITVSLMERFPWLPSTLLFEHRSVDRIVNHITQLSSETGATTKAGGRSEQAAAGTLAAADGIAVVGMDVRCAGAGSPDELWNLLASGHSTVTEVPAGREWFLDAASDSRPHWAGLIDDVSSFDAEFFGISPREAELMDPQLRMFLQVAWGALEDAGAAGDRHDPGTGVFAGVMYNDYGFVANRLSGGAAGLYRSWEGFSLANRLSQLLGFSGPSLAVDTACSSSGTALHLACQALRAGDCRTAIVGGVNLILDPGRFASLGRLGILSPNGRCRPFGDEANGTVLGEGVGVVVLRPLSEALAAGDRIYGVIKGTGVSTGSGTVGFTAPNPVAQSEAIARGLRSAGVDPRTITYVETHGTGTELGDPIEVRGLELAFGRPDLQDNTLSIDPECRIGSIKPNIGHLEAGAGVLGLIKVLLQLSRRQLVPSLTSEKPNPKIPFESLHFGVQTRLEHWPRPSARKNGNVVELPRRAGVSSFGVGGANAHLVVEEAPEQNSPDQAAALRPRHILALSARTEDALSRQVEALASHVRAESDLDLGDTCHTVNTGRKSMERRLAISAGNQEELLQALDRTMARGQTGTAARTVPRIAFLFTGQGSQYARMGSDLYDSQPVFKEALDRVCAALDPLLDRPMLNLVHAPEGSEAAALLNQTGYTQPALFAIEYALAELWTSWGVRPDVVMGHSVGELAAFCFAGGMTLDDAARLVTARGRLMQALPSGGTMASVMAPEGDVLRAIAGQEDLVAIAAINGPEHVVISGDGSAVAEITARFAGEGVKAKPLTVSHAFHSPLMKPMLAEYEAAVRTVTFSLPTIPVISCVDGAEEAAAMLEPGYWLRQVMEPVRFTKGMATLDSLGVDVYVEAGPQPVMLGMGQQCLPDREEPRLWLPSLRRGADSLTTLTTSLGSIWTRGAAVDWLGFDAPYGFRRVPLPLYQFRSRRFWIDAGAAPPLQAPASSRKRAPRRHTIQWQQKALRGTGLSRSGSWTVLAGPDDTAARLSRALEERSQSCTVVSAETNLQAALAAVPRGSRVVSLRHIDNAQARLSSREEDLERHILDAVEAVRWLADGERPDRALWLATRQAVHAGEAGEAAVPLAFDQAALWGLSRTAALEHPDGWGGIIDLPASATDEVVAAIADELVGGDEEDQVALREGTRYVPRLLPEDDGRSASAWKPDGQGTYLITGGTGALGLRIADWLARHGASSLVLTSHSGGTAEALKAVDAIRARGVDVAVVAADVSRPEDVDRVFGQIRGSGRPLKGIVHAAGVDAILPMTDLTPEQVASVMGAKARGARFLHEQSRRDDLDLFLCFSSISSVLGSAGRGAYAAANAVLDGLAHERRRTGLPALSVNWGPWSGGGMATSAQLDELARIGNYGLDPEQALDSLGKALATSTAQTVIADVDWDRFRAGYEARRPRPLVRGLSSGPSDEQSQQAAQASWTQQVLEAAPENRLQEMIAGLQQEIAEAFGFDDSADVRTDQRFSEMGLDSLLAADLASRLKTRLGLGHAGLVFEYPTVELLAARLLEQLPDTQATGAASPVPRVESTRASTVITGYGPTDEADVLAFHELAFPTRRQDWVAPRFRWMFLDSARRLGQEPRLWLYRDNGRIVGHMGAIPVRVKIGAEERDTAWLVDTIVFDQYRQEAAGSRLMVQAHEDLPFSLSLGQTAEMREIQFRLGWKQVAPLQTAQLLVRPERVLSGKVPRPAALAAGLGLRATHAMRDLVRGRAALELTEVGRFDDRHDRLWHRASRDITCGVVRDASYLNWKYVDQPGQTFLRLEAADGDDVRGVTVWMFRDQDEHYAYSRAFLVDVVAPMSDSPFLTELLQSSCQAVSSRGVDSLVCLHTGGALTRALKQCGFRLRAPQRFLLVDPGLPEAPLSLALGEDNWFVTQGDSDVDRPW